MGFDFSSKETVTTSKHDKSEKFQDMYMDEKTKTKEPTTTNMLFVEISQKTQVKKERLKRSVFSAKQ